jgi:hypothetical protein
LFELVRELEQREIGAIAAVQRSSLRAALSVAVSRLGEREARFIIELRHDGIDFRVAPRDLSEVRRHHLARGGLAVADQHRQFTRALEAEIVGGRRRLRFCSRGGHGQAYRSGNGGR